MSAPVRLGAAVLAIGLSACVGVDDLQASNGQGRSFIVVGRSYPQIWQAATAAMSRDMTIVESHRPSGVIKSRIVAGTRSRVVGLFVSPTDEAAPRYTVTIVTRRPLRSGPVDRDWEPAVWDDVSRALEHTR